MKPEDEVTLMLAAFNLALHGSTVEQVALTMGIPVAQARAYLELTQALLESITPRDVGKFNARRKTRT